MSRTLKLADDLSLPIDAVTQTISILAKRRAGKSYTMRRLAEQLLMADQQVVLVDPKGDQWGIRSSADGKGPGLPVIILGGERGDVDLEPGGGELVAKLVVEERVSVLLDLSPFRKHQVATFMTAFLETLYRLKAQERYRTPMMLVIDEADAIAPQKPQEHEARMLGAAEDIVRRGGQRGIGCVLVSQRSAVLNKNVLTQAEILVALRTIAPQDLDAMKAWIDVHGTVEQRKTLMESLPALPIGDAWFWSPGWPTADGIFKRVHVLPIETFDSGATPKPGEKRIEPKKPAEVDLDALKRQMAATIEKAKADDPRELRKQLTEKDRRIKELEQVTSRFSSSNERQKQEVPVLTDADRELIKALRDEFLIFSENIAAKADAMLASLAERAKAAIDDALERWTADVDRRRELFAKRLEGARVQRLLEKIGQAQTATAFHPVRPSVSNHVISNRPAPAASSGERSGVEREPRRPPAAGPGDSSLSSGERKILTVLAHYQAGRTKRQIAVMTGYAVNGGGFNNYLSALRSKGLIEGSNELRLTDAGAVALGPVPALPTGQELRDYWLRQLGKAEGLILDTLCEAYPQALTKDNVAARTGYQANGGGFNNALSRLRTLELIDGRGELRASEELFG